MRQPRDKIVDLDGWKIHVRIYSWEGNGPRSAELTGEIENWAQRIHYTHPDGKNTWRNVSRGPVTILHRGDCKDGTLWEEAYFYEE